MLGIMNASVTKGKTYTVVKSKQPDVYIRDELCQSTYDVFVDVVDHVYHQSIIDHFGLWHDPSAPLVSDKKNRSISLFMMYTDTLTITHMRTNTVYNHHVHRHTHH